MPATICTLVVSWVLEAERREGKRTGTAQLVPDIKERTLFSMLNKLSACAEMSGIPRPAALDEPRKLQSKNRLSQVAAENALVHAVILAAELLQVGEHSTLRAVLVPRARKIVREAAPREVGRNLRLGVQARRARGRATHASHIVTCKTMAM